VSAAREEAPRQYVVAGTAGSGLLVRAGPGADQPVLGVLADGAMVTVAEEAVSDGQTSWMSIRDEDGAVTGFCNGLYLVVAAAPPAQTPAESPPRKVVDARVMGYATGGDGGAVGARTASGTAVHWGTVAADTRLYPFGTRLTIEGFEDVIFTVEDTGSGVRGETFDVWFPDLSTAAAFGTQKRKVTILP